MSSLLLPSTTTLVLVLGCKVEEDNTPSAWLKARLEAAVAYCERHGPLSAQWQVVVSGGAVRSIVAEGDVMKKWLVENHAGFAEQVVAETRAQNTPENVFYTCKMISDSGLAGQLHRFVCVTSDFHITRAQMLLEKALPFWGLNSVELVMVPAPSPGLEGALLQQRLAWEVKCMAEDAMTQKEQHALYAASIAENETI